MMSTVLQSIQDRCLDVILENFERFYEAFKISQGGTLGRLFQFLERTFSETLFHKLLNSGRLQEKYLDFLVNPHLHRLNLEGIEEDVMPGLLRRLNVIENNVKFLRAAQFWKIEVDHYKQLISSVPKVETIELSGIVYAEVLKEIGKSCPLLRVLKILSCDIDDTGLMNIFMNGNGEYENKVYLEQLDMSSTVATSGGVAFVLSHAPSLRYLDYCDTPKVLYEKHKDDLENNCFENSKKYSLTSLSFPSWETNVSDTIKICTALCPDVTSLNIDCLENDEQLLLCAKFHHLKDLKIHVHTDTFSWDGITEFLKLRGRGLLNIHLEGGRVSAEAIVEHCHKLRSLKLCRVNFQPLDKESKCLFSRVKLSNLKALAVTSSDFSVKETVHSVKLILSNTKNLNSANFSGSEGLAEGFIHSLFEFGLLQVHELNFNSSDITVALVTDLLSHGSVQKLCIANCSNITDIDYFNLLVCGGNREISITQSINDDYDDYDFDDYDDYDFDVYDDYDFDVYNDDFDLYDDYAYAYNGYESDYDHDYNDYGYYDNDTYDDTYEFSQDYE